jgi:hypothetical protein
MKEMDISKNLNWSAKIDQLRMLRAITSGSQLSQEDALELSRQINESLYQRYKGLGVWIYNWLRQNILFLKSKERTACLNEYKAKTYIG